MNHGTYSPAGAGGGGENLAPIGAAHIATAGQKDVYGFKVAIPNGLKRLVKP